MNPADSASFAFVFSTVPMRCPACAVDVPADVVHQCGDPLGTESELSSVLASMWGQRAGASTSQAKAKASNRNGQFGGRPQNIAKDQ